MKHLSLLLSFVLLNGALCADDVADQQDQKIEDQRQESRRVEEHIQDQKLEQQRVEARIQDRKLEDQRLERQREDNARWDREHGRDS